MKYLSLWILIMSTQAMAVSFKVATYNMQGWIDTGPLRQKKLNQFFDSQKIMDDVSVIMVQESIENLPLSTTAQLAKEMGWKSYSRKRVSDHEGLGFIYQKDLDVIKIEELQIQAKDSDSDYSRMALSMQFKLKSMGNVRLINTHLAHLERMGPTRKKQLSEIVGWIKTLEDKNPSELIIFGGDFNTGPKETYYQEEFKNLSETTYKFVHAPSTGANFTWVDKASGKTRFIDHFFISHSKKLEVKDPLSNILTYTTENDLSDHNIVILNADLKF